MTAVPRTHASEQDRAAAVAFCAGRDVPCPGCGYNLRDSIDGACPECGRVLALRTDDVRAERRSALWMCAAWNLVVSTTVLGTEALQWLMFGGRPRAYSTEDALQCVLLMFMLVHGVGAVIALLRTRHRPLLGAIGWLRAGWALWGGAVAFILWDVLRGIAAVFAGIDC